ncbi:LLM class flavin-dependent oxidoreductase [Paenalkalicoccus suaedae]|uniref:LLM class flavin-dependent oxidoreductase n=1 Tax=Paenalkalicoccus suaedae TaxID=2592382 RepID=A0A859FEB2_9BACI|nr:LLM class flavin-dependent oxidoreductase [Paenalkalicoccus suaedae]QKS70565.1 LLM class flavin-dependent oxidoreductase [Paenalkalicoccus suaedae]
MKLSILDQSPVAQGQTATQALKHTLDLAQKAEKWGYHRFWISEHHDSESLAGTTPEILLSHIGAHTSSIRLGSGGVMLPHYSPFKVAENFKMLEALYPDRIDAGMGRAPGGMPRATLALSEGNPRHAERFPTQIDDLLRYLRGEPIPEYPYGGAKAAPIVDTPPPVWILGSSGSSAQLAAQKGLPYTFAHFINADGGERFVNHYVNNFTPSEQAEKPQHMVAVFVVCADTDEQANYIASSLDLTMLQLEKGMPLHGTPDPAQASQYEFTPYELSRVEENRRRMIIGGPEIVKAELEDYAKRYQTDEVMVCTITYDHQDRLRSYELISEMF